MKTNFLFIAAENDAILNCKAGGMADVVRDVPREIVKQGDQVSVVTPSYNRLHHNQTFTAKIDFLFRGQQMTAEIYEVTPKKNIKNIKHYVIHHPDIMEGNIAHIYHHDANEPFYNDANKFALFCTAIAASIKESMFGTLDIVHLHDWHTSLLLFLRKFDPVYESLKKIRCVFSIHNLAIQGIRPFKNNTSSVSAWFPDLVFDDLEVRDERYIDCINLMAVGIRLADAVHTVSPSYKEDILKSSSPPEFIGGEGLEDDLNKANNDKKLFGILNGCNYKNIRIAENNKLFTHILNGLFAWLQEPYKKYKADYLTHTGEKVMRLVENPPSFIASSVARLTEQKFYYYKKSPEVLRMMLQELKAINGIYILLGTGVPEYEELLRGLSYDHENLIFVNGQSEDIIDSIYFESDLYLMPSLFEPCGISQMLAMRNGHPCLVHNTGGLKDTIKHLKTGFSFDGKTYDEKMANLITIFCKALDTFTNDKKKWKMICNNAKKERFTWEASVNEYYSCLYKLPLKISKKSKKKIVKDTIIEK